MISQMQQTVSSSALVNSKISQRFVGQLYLLLWPQTVYIFALLFQHVIRGNRPIKAEMAHQLYVLQVLTFNLLEERMMTKMDPNDQVNVLSSQCSSGHWLLFSHDDM